MSTELEQAETELKAAQERVDKLRAHEERFERVYIKTYGVRIDRLNPEIRKAIAAVVDAVRAECAAEVLAYESRSEDGRLAADVRRDAALAHERLMRERDEALALAVKHFDEREVWRARHDALRAALVLTPEVLERARQAYWGHTAKHGSKAARGSMKAALLAVGFVEPK